MDLSLVSLPKSSEIKRGKESIPVALLYLSAYLRNNGIECDPIDFSAILPSTHEVDIEQFIIDYLIQRFAPAPRLVGINCFSSYQFPWVMKIAEELKKNFPGMYICIGGSHPTFFAEEILSHCKFIDFVAIGEGEEQILFLGKMLMNKSNESISNIQALGYRDKNGNVIINPRKNYIENLNIDPKELWGRFQFEDYYSDHSSWNNPKNQAIRLAVPIVTSRSCPFKCTFCSTSKIMGERLRLRDPKNIIDEIEYLNKEFGQTYFEFVDDNINVNQSHVREIFSGIIKRRLDVQFSLASGIHLSSAYEGLIALMADAGLAMIKLPIEHGSDYIRNQVIGKKLKRSRIFEVVRWLKPYDVFKFGLFIMGFPEETVETLEESYNLMLELELDIYAMASLIPFPGTKIFEQCVRDNLLLPGLPYGDLWKGVIHFDSSEHDKFYIRPYNMTIDELQEYRRKFEDISIYSDRAKESIANEC